jgi:hypothetical protein
VMCGHLQSTEGVAAGGVRLGCCCHLHSTAQHRTAQHRTAQHGTAQHSTAQHSTAPHRTAQHSTAQHSTAQHRTAQHRTAPHRTAQHSTAQHSTAQHSTAKAAPLGMLQSTAGDIPSGCCCHLVVAQGYAAWWAVQLCCQHTIGADSHTTQAISWPQSSGMPRVRQQVLCAACRSSANKKQSTTCQRQWV